jgi:hypothetical protein
MVGMHYDNDTVDATARCKRLHTGLDDSTSVIQPAELLCNTRAGSAAGSTC